MPEFNNYNVLASIIAVIASQALMYTTGVSTKTVPSSATSVGIRAYRRFHANDSLIGQPIPCTHAEKLCFQYNVLYFPKHLHCRPIDIDTCEQAGDRNEFFNGSGHLFASCLGYSDPCPGYRMAYDGRCYPKEMVRDVICGCNAKPTQHILGGVECRCSSPEPITVEQPEEEGKCLIPDLRFPVNISVFLSSPTDVIARNGRGRVTLNCSAEQGHCFSMGKVWMAEAGECFSLRERGPCPDEHLVVLDGQAALQGHAVGICVHQRGGCPPGQRRMAFDGCCYHDTDLDLIKTGNFYITEYGNHVWFEAFHAETNIEMNSFNHSNQVVCLLKYMHSAVKGTLHYPQPPCGMSIKGKCHLYEVESEPPKPEA